MRRPTVNDLMEMSCLWIFYSFKYFRACPRFHGDTIGQLKGIWPVWRSWQQRKIKLTMNWRQPTFAIVGMGKSHWRRSALCGTVDDPKWSRSSLSILLYKLKTASCASIIALLCRVVVIAVAHGSSTRFVLGLLQRRVKKEWIFDKIEIYIYMYI